MGIILQGIESTDNIISVRNRNIKEADMAFAEFMQKTEDCFNDRSKANPQKYSKCTPSELEEISVEILKEVSSSTQFRPSDIKLVSGHSFPDIMATDFYGVEVKSTNKDKWTSTGSSIVESTRNESVEKIYMLFGKLGGDPPQFKCKPYQECLSNIAVTHSPRYLIDMELQSHGEKTIFEKIGVDYDSFCTDEHKIDIIRNYYIREAIKSKKAEMPWWVGKKTIDSSENEVCPSIMLMNNCSTSEIKELKAQMLILFPEVINGDYDNAALWLCTHRYLLSLNLRDLFSAGGQWKILNGRQLSVPYPAVLGKILEIVPLIKSYLKTETNLEILEFNPMLCQNSNKYEAWIKQVVNLFSTYRYKVGNKSINFSDLDLDLKDMLTNSKNYILQHK